MDYPYFDIIRHDVLRLVPPDGQVIGSVGCGRAATEAELKKQGRTVYGVDVSADVADVAAGRLDEFRLIGPDDQTPFPAASLDGLILADVLEHLPSAWNRLKDFVKAVKPGGWVVISVPNMRSLKVVGTFLIRGDWPETETGIFDSTHLQVMSKPRLSRWIDFAGLKAERWEVTYLSNVTRLGRLAMTLDRLTGGIGRTWVTQQWQVCCRVKPQASDGA